MNRNRFAEDAAALRRVLGAEQQGLHDDFPKSVTLMVAALRAGRKIIAFGNGGSAADAEHFVGELVGRFLYDRPSLPSVALTGPSAAFTAIANDYGYEQVFARQLRGLGQRGDVALAISTSGNSRNVVLAVEAARELGIATVAMTGGKDSALAKVADLTLRAPSIQTPHIQEVHALLIHSLCRSIEEEIFPEKAIPSLPADKIIGPDQLSAFAEALKPLRVAFTNGCYDLVHPGHLALLRAARALGDLLVVGLNCDDSVRRLKGLSRPILAFPDRAAMLAALEPVDFVVGFDEDTPLELIRKLTPQVLVKGGDYARESIVGADWVESHGGVVKVFPLVGNHSTTRILQSATRNQ